jgi:protein-tyrosine phosphatase
VSEREPLHVTFVCTGNICRSVMAEKMFADQLRRRGLADAVRVSSAGTGNWHVGECADEDRVRMLRSFDPRSGAHTPDVDDPYYGDAGDFERVYTVIDAALPGLHDWVDERLAQNGSP